MINDLMQCASNLIAIKDYEAVAYCYAAISILLRKE
jgi:hypothetical protein